jgi:hypothetical protein
VNTELVTGRTCCEEMRGDAPEARELLRIEERELEAGGLN